ANQLARYLKRRGVIPGSLIGVLMDRSTDYVLACLAVIKAGAAYVPLDPVYPADRLAAMLSDAQVQLVLTTSVHGSKVPPFVVQLSLDVDSHLWSDQPTANLPRQVDGGSLAYAIFTSGSTGRPKAVEVLHAGLSNLVAWHQREYAIAADDRATLYAS